MKRYIILSLLFAIAIAASAQGIWLTSKSRVDDTRYVVSPTMRSTVAVPSASSAMSASVSSVGVSTASFQAASVVRFQTNSRYSAQVSEVGSYTPSVSSTRRYAPPAKDGDDDDDDDDVYDPDNPTIKTNPVGSEICLLFILLLYMAVRARRNTIITNHKKQ